MQDINNFNSNIDNDFINKNPQSLAIIVLKNVQYILAMRKNGGKLMLLYVENLDLHDYRASSKLSDKLKKVLSSVVSKKYRKEEETTVTVFNDDYVIPDKIENFDLDLNFKKDKSDFNSVGDEEVKKDEDKKSKKMKNISKINQTQHITKPNENKLENSNLNEIPKTKRSNDEDKKIESKESFNLKNEALDKKNKDSNLANKSKWNWKNLLKSSCCRRKSKKLSEDKINENNKKNLFNSGDIDFNPQFHVNELNPRNMSVLEKFDLSLDNDEKGLIKNLNEISLNLNENEKEFQVSSKDLLNRNINMSDMRSSDYVKTPSNNPNKKEDDTPRVYNPPFTINNFDEVKKPELEDSFNEKYVKEDKDVIL